MKIDEALLKVFGFQKENEQLYRKLWATDVRYLSAHVGIRKVYEEDDRRLRIEIVIDSQTDKRAIASVWDEIKKQINSLAKGQGHDLNDYLQVAMDALEKGDYAKIVKDESAPPDWPFKQKLIKSKPEYRDLLMDANFDILVFAIRASKGKQDANRAKLAEHYLDNLWRLYAGRMKEADIDTEIACWSEVAFMEIAEGRCPHDIYNDPITYEKLSNKFEVLKELYSHEKRSPLSKESLLKVYGHFVVWGDWNEAAELLEKSFPKTFEKYKPRLDGRLSEIYTKLC